MEEKYLVWHIQGGLGKNVAATSLIDSLSVKYSDRKIVIVASYPEVFLNQENIYRVYGLGNTQYFYDDYIKDKDTLVFRHEPYYETNHILKHKHLLSNWCKLLGIDYDFQKPKLSFNFAQKRMSLKWKREKPIFLIQTNGGSMMSDQEYSWARDLPFSISLEVVEKFKETHHVIQICKPSSLKIPGVEVISDNMSSMELFTLLSVTDKRLLIDSSLQHAATAMNLPSTVIWIATSPTNFGYSIHNNIVSNPPSGNVKLIGSYLFDYSFDGLPYECPYYSLDEMFDVDKILESL
jgi:hypothetical protein